MTGAARVGTDGALPFGIVVYDDTAKAKKAWRVVYRDPAQNNKRLQRYARNAEGRDQLYAEVVTYLAHLERYGLPEELADAGSSTAAARNARRLVDDLMDSLVHEWRRAGRSETYIAGRLSAYNTWVKEPLGSKKAVTWGRTPALSTAVVDAVRVKRAPATTAGVHRLLSRLRSHARDLDWFDESVNPLRGLERAKRSSANSPGPVSDAERPSTRMVDALADAFDELDAELGWGMPWLGLRARVAGRLGLRFAEQGALMPAAVLNDPRRVAVTQAWSFPRHCAPVLKAPKNNKPRAVPVPASLRRSLTVRAEEALDGGGPTGLLFPGRDGPGTPMTDSAFRRYFTLAARRAGWPMVGDEVTTTGLVRGGRPAVPYRTLRHHAAWWMHTVAGFELADVSRYLGHHSVAFTVARYFRSEVDADTTNIARLEDL